MLPEIFPAANSRVCRSSCGLIRADPMTPSRASPVVSPAASAPGPHGCGPHWYETNHGLGVIAKVCCGVYMGVSSS